MQEFILQTPGLVQMLYAAYYFVKRIYTLEQVQEVITHVKAIQTKDTKTLVASLKHEFQSELLRELFYFYYRALSFQKAFLNTEDLQEEGVEQDILYLEGLISVKSKGY
ncbi:unnamed protein product (macronuclear) [Paramecium tetraurelia]|uniref:Uncharacterized protein n=1 Tax=Paramecium tetraurelia TaxID=5888 RepID=A0BRM2_PARTE|nr:uncharacterized protein GSPATT00031420001 [Paramecium tetraurelia]CAK61189.1 unnamed protein product [Paramecium tetraurelia]|eukprot:XP_001428587.1 hypothetical protein (macronuclear) [Paramecium tetraurelia strain d4-2]